MLISLTLLWSFKKNYLTYLKLILVNEWAPIFHSSVLNVFILQILTFGDYYKSLFQPLGIQ